MPPARPCRMSEIIVLTGFTRPRAGRQAHHTTHIAPTNVTYVTDGCAILRNNAPHRINHKSGCDGRPGAGRQRVSVNQRHSVVGWRPGLSLFSASRIRSARVPAVDRCPTPESAPALATAGESRPEPGRNRSRPVNGSLTHRSPAHVFTSGNSDQEDFLFQAAPGPPPAGVPMPLL